MKGSHPVMATHLYKRLFYFELNYERPGVGFTKQRITQILLSHWSISLFCYLVVSLIRHQMLPDRLSRAFRYLALHCVKMIQWLSGDPIIVRK